MRFKRRILLLVLLLGPPLLFALYVLSIGPAYVLIGLGLVSETSLRWIYEPIFRVFSDNGLHTYIEAYIRWWFELFGVNE